MIFGRNTNAEALDTFPASEGIPDFGESSQQLSSMQVERRVGDAAGGKAMSKDAKRLKALARMAALYVGALGVFWGLGLMSLATWGTIALVVLGVCGGLMLVASFSAASVQDRLLGAPMVGCMLAVMLLGCHLAPITQILMGPFAFLALTQGIFTASRRPLLQVTAVFLLAYAVLAGVEYLKSGNQALVTLQGVHVLALLLTLPLFILQMGRVQDVYRSLYRTRRKMKNIQEEAQRDPLTGCFNRQHVLAALEEQKLLADELGYPLCLAVLDIDHFKHINDTLGHLGGDQVLRDFGRIAARNVRTEEVLGRYGGEEFLLIFPMSPLLPALNVCERIREQVEAHGWDPQLNRAVTVSIGVTQYVEGESVLEFFARADGAMYLAKEGGRNQVVVQEPVRPTQSQALPANAPAFSTS